MRSAPAGSRIPWRAWQMRRFYHAARRLVRIAGGRVGEWRERHLSRATLFTRTVLWVTAAVCASLVIGTLSEAWVNYRLQQQVRQVRAENAWLRQDAQTTAGRVAWAESPQTVEDEARARGYARPGDRPVVIASTSQTAQPAAAPAPQVPAPQASTPAGHWLDWWQLFFGG
ncbi:MAG: hypothetical protein PVSMB4_16430 [Ktedonobacterales bacterium]